MTPDQQQLLGGLRVLDLTGTLSGPFCTLLLAQLGATVDKIEPPGGDVVRWLTSGTTPGMSAIHLALNAGKSSIVLDFSLEADRQLLARSLPGYDVVVHNMRPRAARKLGLTVDAIREAGSSALLCEIVGYGPGPYEDRPAYDDTVQAISGMAWVQGTGREPEYVRTVVADKTTGMYAAMAICAALTARANGSDVHEVKVPMFESLVAYTWVEQLGGRTFEPPTGPPLYPRTMSPARRPYRTLDGYVSVMLYTDRHWAAFLQTVGRPELVADERYATLTGRTSHIDEVYATVESLLADRSTDEWLRVLDGIDVPAARVSTFDDLLADPHLTEVGMFTVQEHPTEGPVRSARSPILVDGRPLPGLGPAQRLGGSTEEFRSRTEP